MTLLKGEKPLELQILSDAWITVYALGCAFLVLVGTLALQWIVYDDWLHRTGLRVTGSFVSGALTFALVFRWLMVQRDRKREMLRRFEIIAKMNDRIRNALQAIELAAFATHPGAATPVRSAVDSISEVLEEVLVEARPGAETPKARSRAASLG